LVPQLIELAGEVIAEVSQPENGDALWLLHPMALQTRGAVMCQFLVRHHGRCGILPQLQPIMSGSSARPTSGPGFLRATAMAAVRGSGRPLTISSMRMSLPPGAGVGLTPVVSLTVLRAETTSNSSPAERPGVWTWAA